MTLHCHGCLITIVLESHKTALGNLFSQHRNRDQATVSFSSSTRVDLALLISRELLTGLLLIHDEIFHQISRFPLQIVVSQDTKRENTVLLATLKAAHIFMFLVRYNVGRETISFSHFSFKLMNEAWVPNKPPFSCSLRPKAMRLQQNRIDLTHIPPSRKQFQNVPCNSQLCLSTRSNRIRFLGSSIVCRRH